MKRFLDYLAVGLMLMFSVIAVAMLVMAIINSPRDALSFFGIPALIWSLFWAINRTLDILDR